MPTMNAPGVRVLVSADPTSAVAFVTEADGTEVRVRFHRTGEAGRRWRCDRCGSHARSTCPHEKAAMPVVVEALCTGPNARARR